LWRLDQQVEMIGHPRIGNEFGVLGFIAIRQAIQKNPTVFAG
jgi:hypothetical protein